MQAWIDTARMLVNLQSSFLVTPRLVRFKRFHRRTLFNPFTKATVDVRHIGHAHVLQRLGGQGAAPTGTAEQNELF